MEPGSIGAPGDPPPDDWAGKGEQERVLKILAAALQLPPQDRPAFLELACPGDSQLHSQVAELLQTEAPTASLAPEPPPAFPPGKVLGGRFRIVKLIGRGGMGDVYEAEDLQLGERVALKAIRQGISGSVSTISRFKREIQYAKRVTHLNVCRIYDLGSHREGESETVFLTMELLVGHTLAAHLRASGRMTLETALPLITQMADALGAAHESGIIHRDFKPGNVMLAATGAGLRVVVTDFGLARSLGGIDGATHTDRGRPIGTPAYMAPEQLAGDEVTPAADV